MNRFVRKGEKAIWILAPMVDKNTDGEDGEDERVIRGFTFVPVFDVAQTVGDNLPTICNRLDGDDPAGTTRRSLASPGLLALWSRTTEFNGSSNGDCTHSKHRIRVETRNTPAEWVKTFAHEIARALLHETFDSRARAELEAECMAYIVCQTLGIIGDGVIFCRGTIDEVYELSHLFDEKVGLLNAYVSPELRSVKDLCKLRKQRR